MNFGSYALSVERYTSGSLLKGLGGEAGEGGGRSNFSKSAAGNCGFV